MYYHMKLNVRDVTFQPTILSPLQIASMIIDGSLFRDFTADKENRTSDMLTHTTKVGVATMLVQTGKVVLVPQHGVFIIKSATCTNMSYTVTLFPKKTCSSEAKETNRSHILAAKISLEWKPSMNIRA